MRAKQAEKIQLFYYFKSADGFKKRSCPMGKLVKKTWCPMHIGLKKSLCPLSICTGPKFW